MLCKWDFELWPRDRKSKRCTGNLGPRSMKYLRSEVRGADVQGSGMSPGPRQQPLIVSWGLILGRSRGLILGRALWFSPLYGRRMQRPRWLLFAREAEIY